MPENHTSDDVGGVSAFAACVVETVGVGQSEIAVAAQVTHSGP